MQFRTVNYKHTITNRNYSQLCYGAYCNSNNYPTEAHFVDINNI